MCLNAIMPSDIAVRAQQWLSRCLVRAWLDDTVVERPWSLPYGLLADLWWGTREQAWGEDLLGSASVMRVGCRVGPSFVELSRACLVCLLRDWK